MHDYIRRFLIAGIMMLCISLLFLGGKRTHAEMINIEEITNHWVWPADGVITDTYGTRQGTHYGVDVAGGTGTSIYAVDKGVVTKSYFSGSYGNVVFIKHSNNLETVYAHLKTRHVQEGQAVNQGQIIGEMGSTGDSSGVHLHFEVHEKEWTVDKKNAINPIVALGDVEMGETVQALMDEHKTKVMAAATKIAIYDGLEASSEDNEKSKQENAKREVNAHAVTHIVEPGETLWSIAKIYQSSVKSIAETNQLKNFNIYPKQELRVRSDALNEYTVKEGDTLTSISIKTGNSISKLKHLNKLKSDVIHPQQVLIYQLVK